MSDNATSEASDSNHVIGVDASQLIKDNHIEYGEDIFRNSFPQIGDGLKVLYRRIVWALYGVDDIIKSSAAVAHVMKYHPHGDVSIYDGIVRLASYRAKTDPRHGHIFNPPVLQAGGNMANPNAPAASRYTGVAMGEFGRDLFFKGIEKDAIPVSRNSDGFVEPLYMIPVIPTSIYIGVTTVGFGHGAKLPPRNFNSICDISIAYCEHVKKYGLLEPFPAHEHGEKLVPDFYLENTILNADELLEEYRNGNFGHEIKYSGSVTLTKDMIYVNTLPYGSSKSAYEKIQEILLDKRQKGSFLDQNIVDIMDEPNRCAVYLKKNNVSSFEVWQHLKQAIGFTAAFHPNYNYCTVDGHLNLDVPVNVLLEIWYRRRSSLMLGSKRRQLERLSKQIRIVEARLIIIRDTDKALKIIRNNSFDDAVTLLMKSFKLSYTQADYIVSSKLSILTKTGGEELRAEYERLLERFKELQESFDHIPDELIASIQALRKKHSRERITEIPKYVGCVKIGSGYVQISDFSEIEELLVDFPRVPVRVMSYGNSGVMVIDSKGKVLTDPKEKYGEGDVFLTPSMSPHTVFLGDDKTGMCAKGILPPQTKNGQVIYTTKKSRILYKDGWVKSENVTDVLSIRKSISKGSKTDIIAVYPNYKTTHFIAVLSDRDKDVITVYRVSGEPEQKLVLNSVGTKCVFTSFNGNDWYLDVPEKFLSRSNVRLFHLNNVDRLLGDKDRIRIEVNVGKWRKNPHFSVITN